MVGLKCGDCGSYNTSRSGNEEVPTESAEEEEDIEEDDSDGVYNEEDRVRLALLRQRLGAIIRQWEHPTEGERSGSDNRNQQQNVFYSFVNQLQLFQGMLDDFSGRFEDDSESDESDLSQQSSSVSEASDGNDDNGHDGNDDEESDVEIADTYDDDDPADADDEDDSSNISSPSFTYFSRPHPINLDNIYNSGDSSGEDADSNSSWETEEEEEVIGEAEGNANNNMGDTHTVQRQNDDVARLSGSLGSFTLECQSGSVCVSVCVSVYVCV